MARADKGYRGRHLCDRHASAGYPERERSDGNIYRGLGIADFIFRSTERTGKYQEAASRGHRSGQAERSPLRQAGDLTARQLRGDRGGMGGKEDHICRGYPAMRHERGYILPPFAGVSDVKVIIWLAITRYTF